MSCKVIYVSKACDSETYKNISFKTNIAAVQFNYSLLKGISETNEVHSLYVIDTNLKEEKIIQNGNVIQYLFNNNNHFSRLIYMIKKCIHLLKEKDTILIADVLNYSDAFISCMIAKIFRRSNIGIVTDLPEYIGDYVPKENRTFKYKMMLKLKYYIINQFNKYIFLTKNMKEKIPVKSDKFYYVMEGVCNPIMFNQYMDLPKENQIMYAGSLHKEYGIQNLINAFEIYNKKSNSNLKLVIYGSGNYKEEIEKIVKKNKFIEYRGVAEHSEILKEECKSVLLVNPRPIYDGKEESEYELYSFPSKTIEYMTSGTPLLTTKLSGMPENYLDYLYVINDASVNGILEALEKTLSYDIEILNLKGKKARKFMIENKSGKSQFEQIYSRLIK